MHDTDHDESIRNGSCDVTMALERKRENREHASETIDRHERQRDTDNRAVLVDLVELRSAKHVSRETLIGGPCGATLQEGERD
jgi:hypothetical protein